MTGQHVAVVGDWHGNSGAMQHVLGIVAAQRPDIRQVWHVGDFGLWHGRWGADWLADVQAECERLDLTITVTLGNHENYNVANGLLARAGGSPAVLRTAPRVSLLPRGYRFEQAGRTIVSLGGAGSIDRFLRVPGQSWWRAEEITAEDVDGSIAGGTCDVLLCHDTPRPAHPDIEAALTPGESGFGRLAEEWCRQSQEQLTRAYDALRPQLTLHGHWHLRRSHDSKHGRIESIAMERMPGSVVFLDLGTLRVADAS